MGAGTGQRYTHMCAHIPQSHPPPTHARTDREGGKCGLISVSFVVAGWRCYLPVRRGGGGSKHGGGEGHAEEVGVDTDPIIGQVCLWIRIQGLDLDLDPRTGCGSRSKDFM